MARAAPPQPTAGPGSWRRSVAKSSRGMRGPRPDRSDRRPSEGWAGRGRSPGGRLRLGGERCGGSDDSIVVQCRRVGLGEAHGEGAAEAAAVRGDQRAQEGPRRPVVAEHHAGMNLGLEAVAGLDATGHVQVSLRPEQQALGVGQAAGAARDERPEEGARTRSGGAFELQHGTGRVIPFVCRAVDAGEEVAAGDIEVAVGAEDHSLRGVQPAGGCGDEDCAGVPRAGERRPGGAVVAQDSAGVHITDIQVAVGPEDLESGMSDPAAAGRDEAVQERAGLAIEAIDARTTTIGAETAVDDVEVAVRSEHDATGVAEVLAGEHGLERPARAVELQHILLAGLEQAIGDVQVMVRPEHQARRRIQVGEVLRVDLIDEGAGALVVSQNLVVVVAGDHQVAAEAEAFLQPFDGRPAGRTAATGGDRMPRGRRVESDRESSHQDVSFEESGLRSDFRRPGRAGRAPGRCRRIGNVVRNASPWNRRPARHLCRHRTACFRVARDVIGAQFSTSA